MENKENLQPQVKRQRPKGDSLGDRMKENYEMRSRVKLVRRMPAIIRIDGKAFHTFTRGFAKPFDRVFMQAMKNTLHYLCENIQGCVYGYTQSDEITLVLIDYKTLETSAWFDYQVQKMVSVAASMASAVFNREFARIVGLAREGYFGPVPEGRVNKAYGRALDSYAVFDARAFNVPREEVANCIIWRQQDCVRNSVQALAQDNFSPKEMFGKSCAVLKEMLINEKDLDWDDLCPDEKYGSFCLHVQRNPEAEGYWEVINATDVYKWDSWLTDLVNPDVEKK